MNLLSLEKRVQILSCLVEGNSIRATCRITGAAKRTVTRLLCEVGAACHHYQDHKLTGLTCRRIECDEIWSFCYCKEKNIPRELKHVSGIGSIWTWVAIDADTKLVVTWYVGHRDEEAAYLFLEDLEPRLKGKVQISTDGHRPYRSAMQGIFGINADYGIVEKQYGPVIYQTELGERRYSPNECIGSSRRKVRGNMKDEDISTSFVERQNLTMRMGMRRFTRLTNGFSKKIQNLEHAIALHFMYYNFCRPHQSLNQKRALGITPAMVAGVADHRWSLEELLELLKPKDLSL